MSPESHCMPVLRLKVKTFLLPFCLFHISLPCSCYLCTAVSYLTFSIRDNQRCRNLLVSLLKPPTLSPRQRLGTVEPSPAELSWARLGLGLGLGSPAAGCSWIHAVQLHCRAWDTIVSPLSSPHCSGKSTHPSPPSLPLMVRLYFAVCSRLLLFPETFSPSQLPPPPTFNNSTAFWPLEDCTTPSPLGTNTLYQIPPSLSPCGSISAWPSSESATIAPISAPHLCTHSSRGPKCPLLVSSTHPVPRRAAGISKASPTTHPNQILSASPDVEPQAGGDTHKCPKATLPIPPLPGQGLPVGSTGLGAAGIFCHSPSPPARILFGELIFQPVSSGASLRATWWTKGTFSNFLIRRRGNTWGNKFFVEEFGWVSPDLNFVWWEMRSCDIPW